MYSNKPGCLINKDYSFFSPRSLLCAVKVVLIKVKGLFPQALTSVLTQRYKQDSTESQSANIVTFWQTDYINNIIILNVVYR